MCNVIMLMFDDEVCGMKSPISDDSMLITAIITICFQAADLWLLHYICMFLLRNFLELFCN